MQDTLQRKRLQAIGDEVGGRNGTFSEDGSFLYRQVERADV